MTRAFARLLPLLFVAGASLAVARGQPGPFPAPAPPPPADAWGEVRVTPERTPAVDFAVAPGGRGVAFFGYTSRLYLYDTAADKVRVEVPCEDAISDAAYSPDGKTLATAEWVGGGLKLRDALSGVVKQTLKPAGGLGVSSVRYLPCGKLVAWSRSTAGALPAQIGQLGLWEMPGRKSIGWPPRTRVEAGGDMVRERFVTGGRLLAVETRSQAGYVMAMSVTLTDPAANTTSPAVILSMDDYVLDASPDGKTLLVFNVNRPPRLVDVASGRCTLVLVGGHRQPVTCGAFSPDGKSIATASGTTSRSIAQVRSFQQFQPFNTPSEIVVWDAATGRRVATCPEPTPRSGFTALQFSPDGRLIAAMAGQSDSPNGTERKGGRLVLWGKFSAAESAEEHAARFQDQGDHVADAKTGLLWQKDGSASGRLDYYQAIRYATTLELAGRAGWRLPTPKELAEIYPAAAPFANTRFHAERPPPKDRADYWTSATDPAKPDAALVFPWCPGGAPTSTSASQTRSFVRCVHDPVRK